MPRLAKHAVPTGLATALAALLFMACGLPAAAQTRAYKEAPALAEQVKAGKLPPVGERLPAAPLVVPVVEKVG